MKKKILIPIVVALAVVILGIVLYNIPKTFGKSVDAAGVDHIDVFDGNTGVGFTITDPEDIRNIVENIKSHPMKRAGISLFYMGYSFRIKLKDSNDKNIIPEFILNSDNTIRKDPFFYRCDSGLCYEYLEQMKDKYAGQ